mmetsp:Transcript_28969/g.56689  ORF Transcript_28969/g.56689 Transcript_28969/m.56689 type:complete len:94 (-) Transcript_28969:481-762(-)
MGFFIPALLAGGLTMGHYEASKELDTFFRQSSRPLFGFWWGLGIGTCFGIWMGVNFGPVFVKFVGVTDWLTGGFLSLSDKPKSEEDHDDDDDD